MASTEALNALIENNSKWENYRINHSGIIDLKLAELKDFDLEGRILSNCDFSGADLENANLDKCKINDSIFNNTCLEGASLVFCSLSSSAFDKANLKSIIARESSIDDINFINTNLKEADFSHCKLAKCNFSESKLDSIKIDMSDIFSCKFNKISSVDLNITNTEFLKSIFNSSVFKKSLLQNLNFNNCYLQDFEISSSSMNTVNITRSNIAKFSLNDTKVSRINLSNSILTDVDLSQYDLPNTIFLYSAINNCVWPVQKGTTTITGKYLINPNLLGQPVQDVKGLSPSLRREIADAQYLKEILPGKGITSRLLLRIWGITTDYGQSLIRLTTVSTLTILLLSCIFVLCDGEISAWPENIKNGLNAIGYVSSTFFGFGVSGNLVMAKAQELLLLAARIFGFFTLGLWIGLAANKIGKLSAE